MAITGEQLGFTPIDNRPIQGAIHGPSVGEQDAIRRKLAKDRLGIKGDEELTYKPGVGFVALSTSVERSSSGAHVSPDLPPVV